MGSEEVMRLKPTNWQLVAAQLLNKSQVCGCWCQEAISDDKFSLN